MIHYTEVSQCLVYEGENRRVLKVGKISHLEIWWCAIAFRDVSEKDK